MLLINKTGRSPKMVKLDKLIFQKACDDLATKDEDLKRIIVQYGYPPFWSRKPGFETLIHIILEQQVSLASAKAALFRLRERIKKVTPTALLLLTDEELKDCYFSRQKIRYSRELAQAIISRKLPLKRLEGMSDQQVKLILQQLPGIGEWTTDVYLMMALHRPDCFPLGDIALVNSLKTVKNLARSTSKESLEVIADAWRPFRTVAAYLLWHVYLCKKGMKYMQEGHIPHTL